MLSRALGTVAVPAAGVLNSTIRTLPLVLPMFSLLWVWAGTYIADSLAISLSSDLPSGIVNRVLAVPSGMISDSGCECIAVFAPGARFAFSTRTLAFSSTTV
jgi:hypothetical protein